MYDTNDDFVYNEGCESKVFSIYALYGNLVICTLLAVIIVNVRESLPKRSNESIGLIFDTSILTCSVLVFISAQDTMLP